MVSLTVSQKVLVTRIKRRLEQKTKKKKQKSYERAKKKC